MGKNSSNKYDYYSDEDVSEHEHARLEMWNKIKRIPFSQYLRNSKTREIMEEEWRRNFNNALEEKLIAIFNKYFNESKTHGLNFLYKADEKHAEHFVNLIFMNLIGELSMDVFEERPYLANSLLDE